MVLVAALLGGALYLWQQSAYETGVSEALYHAALTKPPAKNISEKEADSNQFFPAAVSNPAPSLNQNADLNLPAAEPQFPPDYVEELFNKAINDKNAPMMESLMAAQVNYIIEATECCGSVEKAEAVKDFLDYAKGTRYFDFAEDQTLAKKIKVNLASSFGNKRVGIGNDEKVAAYRVDPKTGKVDDLYVAVTHKLFDLE